MCAEICVGLIFRNIAPGGICVGGVNLNKEQTLLQCPVYVSGIQNTCIASLYSYHLCMYIYIYTCNGERFFLCAPEILAKRVLGWQFKTDPE